VKSYIFSSISKNLAIFETPALDTQTSNLFSISFTEFATATLSAGFVTSHLNARAEENVAATS
jgi:hypothetical protein